MAPNPQIPVQSTNPPAIPPVSALRFVGPDGKLLSHSFQFLQQLWALAQGNLGIIDQVALDQSSALLALIAGAQNEAGDIEHGLLSPAPPAPADLLARLEALDAQIGVSRALVPGDLLARLDALDAQIGAFRAAVPALIQRAVDDVMAYIPPPAVSPAQPYIVAPFVPGTMTTSQLLALHRFVDSAIVPVDFNGSQFGATVNATGSTVINIDRALSSAPNTFSTIGTITVGAGTVVGTFATVSHLAYLFSAGDVIRAIAPVAADATLANVYFAIAGARSPAP